NGFEILLDDPVLEGLELHDVEAGIGASEREEINLADGTPVGAHLGHDAGRQGDLREPFENALAVPGVGFLVIENQLEIRKPEEGEGAQMNDVRDAVHHDFERYGYLLLDLFRGDSRPLGDDFHVVVRHVGIGLDGKLMEGNCSPAKEQESSGEDKKAISQSKIDEFSNHLLIHRVLQHERILNDASASLDTR